MFWKYACSRFYIQDSTYAKVQFIELTLWHGCSPINLLHIFRTPFRTPLDYGWSNVAKFNETNLCIKRKNYFNSANYFYIQRNNFIFSKYLYINETIIYIFKEIIIYSTNYLHIQGNNYFYSTSYLYIQQNSYLYSTSYLYIQRNNYLYIQRNSD